MHRAEGGPATREGPRLHGDLGHPGARSSAVQGLSASYHGYWGLDFTTVDPHLGTDADFAAFVECAHRLDMKVYLDVVVNHTGDVVALPGGASYSARDAVPRLPRQAVQRRDLRRSADIPVPRAANFRRSPVLPAGQHRKAAGVAQRRARATTTVATSSSTRARRSASSRAISSGSTTSSPSSRPSSTGSPTSTPVGSAGTRSTGSASTPRSTSTDAFFKVWVPRIKAAARAAGVDDFQIFGEVFLTDALELSSYVREPRAAERGRLSAPGRGSSGSPPASACRAGSSRGSRTTTTSSAPRGGSHADDVPRQPRRRPGRALIEDDPEPSATSCSGACCSATASSTSSAARPSSTTATRSGSSARGGDKQARQDLFPTQRRGVADRGTRRRAADRNRLVVRRRRPSGRRPPPQLGALRQAHPALVHRRHDRPARGHGVTRAEPRRRGDSARVPGGVQHRHRAGNGDRDRPRRRSASGRCCSARRRDCVSSAAGRLTLSVPPLDTVLVRALAAVPVRAPARPSLVVRADELTNLVQARATVASLEPVSVSFALKRAGGVWRRVAADGSPPYRGFLEPRQFRRRRARPRGRDQPRWPRTAWRRCRPSSPPCRARAGPPLQSRPWQHPVDGPGGRPGRDGAEASSTCRRPSSATETSS